MSYILDALKKADQAREYGQVPGIDSAHEQPLQMPPRRRWPWILAVAFLANVLLITGLWWQFGANENAPVNARGHLSPPVSQSVPDDSTGMVPPPTRARPVAVAKSAASAVTTASTPVETAVTPAIETPQAVTAQKAAPAVELTRSASAIALRPLPLPAPTPATVPAAPKTVPESVEKVPQPGMPQMSFLANRTDVVELRAAPQPRPPPQAEPAWKKLPLWPLVAERIRRQVKGRLVLNAHVYSVDPAERFVILNMQKYKEGEQIPEGPDLEQVTRDGVILAVPDGRFRLE